MAGAAYGLSSDGVSGSAPMFKAMDTPYATGSQPTMHTTGSMYGASNGGSINYLGGADYSPWGGHSNGALMDSSTQPGMGGSYGFVNPDGSAFGSMYGFGYSGMNLGPIPSVRSVNDIMHNRNSMYGSGGFNAGSMLSGSASTYSLYGMDMPSAPSSGCLYGGSLFGRPGTLYGTGGSLYGSRLGDGVPHLGSMVDSFRPHCSLGRVVKGSMKYCYTFDSCLGNVGSTTTSMQLGGSMLSLSRHSDRTMPPSDSKIDSPVSQMPSKVTGPHGIPKSDNCMSPGSEKSLVASVPGSHRDAPAADTSSASTPTPKKTGGSPWVPEVPSVPSAPSAPSTPSAPPVPSTATVPSAVETASTSKKVMDDATKTMPSSSHRIHTVAILQPTDTGAPAITTTSDQTIKIKGVKGSKDVNFDEVISFRKGGTLIGKYVDDMLGHLAVGHNTVLLVADDGRATLASNAVILDVCAAMMKKLKSWGENGNYFTVNFSMAAVNDKREMKDLMTPGATYTDLSLGSSPLFGPAICNVHVKDFVEEEALLSQLTLCEKHTASEDKLIVCQAVVRLVRKPAQDGRQEVFVASQTIAISKMGMQPFIEVAAKTDESGLGEILRYAFGGPAVTVLVVCLHDGNDACEDLVDMARSMEDVRSAVPRSGNVSRFVYFAERCIAKEKDECLTASPERRKALEANVERLEAMIHQAQLLINEPQATKIKVYHSADLTRELSLQKSTAEICGPVDTGSAAPVVSDSAARGSQRTDGAKEAATASRAMSATASPSAKDANFRAPVKAATEKDVAGKEATTASRATSAAVSPSAKGASSRALKNESTTEDNEKNGSSRETSAPQAKPLHSSGNKAVEEPVSNKIVTMVVADGCSNSMYSASVASNTIAVGNTNFQVDSVIEKANVKSSRVDAKPVNDLINKFLHGYNTALISLDGSTVTTNSFDSPAWAVVRQAAKAALMHSASEKELRVCVALVKNTGEAMDLCRDGPMEKLEVASSPLYGPIVLNAQNRVISSEGDLAEIMLNSMMSSKGKWGNDTTIIVSLLFGYREGDDVVVSSLMASLYERNTTTLSSILDRSSPIHDLYRYAFGGTAATLCVVSVSPKDDVGFANAALEVQKRSSAIAGRPLRRGSVNFFVQYTRQVLQKRQKEVAKRTDAKSQDRWAKTHAAMEAMMKDHVEVIKSFPSVFPNIYCDRPNKETASRSTSAVLTPGALPSILEKKSSIKALPRTGSGGAKSSGMQQGTPEARGNLTGPATPADAAARGPEGPARDASQLTNGSCAGNAIKSHSVARGNTPHDVPPSHSGAATGASSEVPPPPQANRGDKTPSGKTDQSLKIVALVDDATCIDKQRISINGKTFAVHETVCSKPDSVRLRSIWPDTMKELDKTFSTAHNCSIFAISGGDVPLSAEPFFSIFSRIVCNAMFNVGASEELLMEIFVCIISRDELVVDLLAEAPTRKPLGGCYSPLCGSFVQGITGAQTDSPNVVSDALKRAYMNVALYKTSVMEEGAVVVATAVHRRKLANGDVRIASFNAILSGPSGDAYREIIDVRSSATRKQILRGALYGPSSSVCLVHAKTSDANIQEMLSLISSLARTVVHCQTDTCSIRALIASTPETAKRAFQIPVLPHMPSDHRVLLKNIRSKLPLYPGGLAANQTSTSSIPMPKPPSSTRAFGPVRIVAVITKGRLHPEGMASKATTVSILSDTKIAANVNGSSVSLDVSEVLHRPSAAASVRSATVDDVLQNFTNGNNAALLVCDLKGSTAGASMALRLVHFFRSERGPALTVYASLFVIKGDKVRDALMDGSCYFPLSIARSPFFGPCADGIKLVPLITASGFERRVTEATVAAEADGGLCVLYFVGKCSIPSAKDVRLNSFLVTVAYDGGMTFTHAVSNSNSRGILELPMGGSCMTAGILGVSEREADPNLSQALSTFESLRSVKTIAKPTTSVLKVLERARLVLKGYSASLHTVTGASLAGLREKMLSVTRIIEDGERLIANPDEVPKVYSNAPDEL